MDDKKLTLNNTGVKQFDEETEKMLDNWVLAKRGKDFPTADRLRDQIRAKGIEPDKARPPDRLTQSSSGSASLTPGLALTSLQPISPAFVVPPPPPSVPPEQLAALLAMQQQGNNADALGQQAAQIEGVGGKKDWQTLNNTGVTQFDDETEKLLDNWVLAKRGKDFATADRLRDEIRAKGIEPDKARPPDRTAPNTMPGASMPMQAQSMQRQLQQLQQMQAIQTAQLQQAQALQIQQLTGQAAMSGQLVSQPIGAANFSPYSASISSGPPSKRARKLDIQATQTFDASTESRLDDWIEAKRAKQFAKADAIREELRALGIEPDEVRPPGRNFGKV